MADVSSETIQGKIQIARRDAEALKDRIKRKKDELADTTRESIVLAADARLAFPKAQGARGVHVMYTDHPEQSAMWHDNEPRPCRAWR